MIMTEVKNNTDDPIFQIRILGVSVLVGAWWLDAAAKGIPPTIPVVNANTVRDLGKSACKRKGLHIDIA